MHKIEKLLRKIIKQDRVRLLKTIELILQKDKRIKAVKIKNTDFFRVRCLDFRIIFHEENGEIIIDGIKLRDENTYKNLQK